MKTFVPIILFSIVLPLVDIVTDLRLIIRLYTTSTSCDGYDPDHCNIKFATLLLCKYEKIHVVPSRIFNNTNEFSPILVKLCCFIHKLVSDGEEQDLDICSAIT